MSCGATPDGTASKRHIGQEYDAYDGDTRYSRRIRLSEEILYDLVGYLKKQKVQGTAPRRTLVYGSTFDPRPADAKYTAALDEFVKLMGAPALGRSAPENLTDDGQIRGYFDVRTIGMGLEAYCKKLQAEKQQKLQAEIQQQLEKEQQQKHQTQAKKQQKEIERLLQQDLVQSSSVKSGARSAQVVSKTNSISTRLDNKEIDRYKSLIISAISHRWVVPENLKKGLECRLKVRVAPAGMVMDVKLLKASGDAALDRSAQAAIYKASPLPVPKEAALFNEFREFNLTVRPEGILAE